MHFLALAVASLPVLAWAAPTPGEFGHPPHRGNGHGTPDRFKGIHHNLTSLLENVMAENYTLNTSNGTAQQPYNGTSLFQLYVIGQAIGSDINTTTYTANRSYTNTVSQSDRTYDFLAYTLYPATSSLLNNFIAKYDAVNATGIAGLVVSTLQTQRQLTADLGAALERIANGSSVQNGPILSAAFDNAFVNTINYYQEQDSQNQG